MDDIDLDFSVEMLEQILGRKVTIAEPEEEALEPSSPKEVASSLKHRQMEMKSEPAQLSEVPTSCSPGPDRAPKYRDVDSSSLRIGHPVDENVAFCPWSAITGYPLTFIGKTNKPRATPFFDKILEGKVWDFFYLHDPTAPQEQAVLLVPTAQFDRFLEGVNAALGIALTIPPGVNSKRFCVKFGQGGTPRPRYLKRFRDEQTLTIETRPEPSEDDVKAFKSATPANQAMWLSRYQKLTDWPSIDRTAAAARRRETRMLSNRTMITNSQSYLGLVGDSKEQVVFISIDIECIEVQPHPISEIGIAILDTAAIDGKAGGPGGSEWWSYATAHHIRTKEYSGLVNYRYVQGCPDAFNFGSSSISSPEADLVSSIKVILTPYTEKNRHLVLVGHDIRSDFKMLMKLGFNIQELPGVVCELDTQCMHQAWKKTEKARSLEVALSDLGIENCNLHNAGNDAVYTLRAMMALALEDMCQTDAEEENREYMPALWAGSDIVKQ